MSTTSSSAAAGTATRPPPPPSPSPSPAKPATTPVAYKQPKRKPLPMTVDFSALPISRAVSKTDAATKKDDKISNERREGIVTADARTAVPPRLDSLASVGTLITLNGSSSTGESSALPSPEVKKPISYPPVRSMLDPLPARRPASPSPPPPPPPPKTQTPPPPTPPVVREVETVSLLPQPEFKPSEPEPEPEPELPPSPLLAPLSVASTTTTQPLSIPRSPSSHSLYSLQSASSTAPQTTQSTSTPSAPPAIPEYSSRRTSIASARTHGLLKGSITSVASFSSAVSADNNSTYSLALSRASSHAREESSGNAAAGPSSVPPLPSIPLTTSASTTTMLTTTTTGDTLSVASSRGGGGSSGVEDAHTVSEEESLAKAVTDSTPAVPASERKADYVTYMRRQKATVWCDRVPTNLITKSKTRHTTAAHGSSSKKKKDSQRADEFSSYMHAYAYYQPKLDMTLELSDARVVSHSSSRLALRALDQDDETVSLKSSVNETTTTRSSSTLDLNATTTGLFKSSTLASVGSSVTVASTNDANGAANNRLSGMSSARNSVHTVASTSHLQVPGTPGTPSQVQNSGNGSVSGNNLTPPYPSVGTPASGTSVASKKASNESLADTLLEDIVAPRRTLYIANPDYSSSDEE
ncbi:hypothetical protein BZA70DRAFT_288692 [Myxozyma melibiosi]|uniref:Uncharacterized protein n=1 Tax=Myxozyma melibiosi TaxID=54550 RepID=A0ABR1F8Y7_9ASCO